MTRRSRSGSLFRDGSIGGWTIAMNLNSWHEIRRLFFLQPIVWSLTDNGDESALRLLVLFLDHRLPTTSALRILPRADGSRPVSRFKKQY